MGIPSRASIAKFTVLIELIQSYGEFVKRFRGGIGRGEAEPGDGGTKPASGAGAGAGAGMAVRRRLQIAGTKPIFRKGGFSRSGLQVSRFLQVLKAARARWKARSVAVMTR